jgi:hypothetical protein
MRLLLASGLMALLPSCVVAGHAEPWAPVVLRTDPAAWHPNNEVFVYVDDVYRGNLVDGAFRMYLTLEPHRLEVHFPGHEPLERTVTLTDADYPDGIELVVAPPGEEPR